MTYFQYEMRKIIYGIIVCLGVLACTSTQINPHSNQENTQSNSENDFDYKIILQSEYGGSGEEEWFLWLEKETFQNYWIEYQFNEMPEVDFEKEMIIMKNFESQRSGGNQYSVNKVENQNSTIKVYYTITSNSSGMATQAITSPVIIIQTQKVENPTVKFIQMK